MKLKACEVCQLRKAGLVLQVYIINGELGTWGFDIARAATIVADGRSPVLVPPEILNRFLEVNNEWCEAHLPHVDPNKPGIVGQRFGGIALFDGTHRAVKAHRTNRPFYAFMLTFQESTECLVHHSRPAMTAERIARELRGVIKNNRGTEMIEAEFELDDGEKADENEQAIRSHLTPEENKHVRLCFHRSRSHP
jgi:hypothetical protein